MSCEFPLIYSFTVPVTVLSALFVLFVNPTVMLIGLYTVPVVGVTSKVTLVGIRLILSLVNDESVALDLA